MNNKVINMPEHENANCRMVIIYAWNSRKKEYCDITSIELWSYTTHVATFYRYNVVDFGKSPRELKHKADSIEIFGWWSTTTARHILWFKRYIAQAIYQKRYDCWKGDCSKAKAIKATVYNPIVITLE